MLGTRATEALSARVSPVPNRKKAVYSTGIEPKRSVWTMLVVVLDIPPEDLFRVTTADDQQPVEHSARTVPIHRSAEALAFGAWTGVTSTSAPLGPEHLVEPTTELRVAVAEHKAQSLSPIRCRQEQVAGLLGDPGTIGVGRHAGQVDPAGGQFNDEQHLQPPQPEVSTVNKS